MGPFVRATTVFTSSLCSSRSVGEGTYSKAIESVYQMVLPNNLSLKLGIDLVIALLGWQNWVSEFLTFQETEQPIPFSHQRFLDVWQTKRARHFHQQA